MKTAQNKPIGVFDSGIGGLSVWRELRQYLPNESMIYFADSGNCPYGSKSKEEIIALAANITDFLLAKGAKMIVVACNTATAMAIDYLRETYNVAFVGIEPAVKPAALLSKTKHIGVLATEGTFKGRHFLETSSRFANEVQIHSQAGIGLVELVEKGQADTDATEAILRKYIGPMLEVNIDQLVLGCTHYPFLMKRIRKITGPGVNIIDPAEAIARRTRDILEQNDMLAVEASQPQYEFHTSGSGMLLEALLSSITQDKFTIHETKSV
jgi:glutamate racemase